MEKNLFFSSHRFFHRFWTTDKLQFIIWDLKWEKSRILNFHSHFDFPAMLVVCGWSIWTPPVIRVHTHPHIVVLRHLYPNLRWVSFELIWGLIWAHMRCHLSSYMYEMSFDLIWAHLISNDLKWHLIWAHMRYQMRCQMRPNEARPGYRKIWSWEISMTFLSQSLCC